MATSYPKASLSKLRPLLPEQEDPLARILQNSSQLPPEASGDELAQLLQAVSSAPPRFQAPKVPLVLAPQKPAMRAPKPPMKLPIRGPMQGPAPMPSDIAAAQANQVPTPEANPIEATPAQTYKAVMPELPAVARGSGMTREGKNTSTMGEKHATTSNIYDTDKIDPVMEYLRNLPEMEGLRGQQSQLENMIRMEQAKPAQLDLTPLMALTDQWSGSNLAKSYKAPTDKAARILAFQEKLGDNQRDIAKTLIDAVSKIKTGTQADSSMAQLIATLNAKNEDSKRFEKALGKLGQPRPLPITATKDVQESVRAGELADSIITSSEAHPEFFGTGMGTIADLTGKLGLTFGSPDLAQMQMLQRDFKMFQQQAGKPLEGGVLRKEDEKKYRELIGGLNGDAAVALRNMKEMQAMIKRGIASKLGGYKTTGYNIGDLDRYIQEYGAAGLPTPVGIKETAPKAPPKTKTKILSNEEFLKLSKEARADYLKKAKE